MRIYQEYSISKHSSINIQIQTVILVHVLYPTVAKTLLQQLFQVNVAKDVSHGNMQQAWELDIHQYNRHQYRIFEVNNVIMTHTINKIVSVYTFMDLMEELV